MKIKQLGLLFAVAGIGGALAGAGYVGRMPDASAQADTNSVAACYADGTYKHVTWGNVGDLQDAKDIVTIMVLHAQSPGEPNAVEFTGHDRYAVRRLPNGLLVRWSDTPPGTENSTERAFRDNGDQEANRALGNSGSGNGIGGGMHGFFYSKDWQDSDYDAMPARCVDKLATFRAQTVPAEGT